MAQSVKHPTLDLGSAHDLRVLGSSVLSSSLLKILSLSLCPPPPEHSLKKKKKELKKKMQITCQNSM